MSEPGSRFAVLDQNRPRQHPQEPFLNKGGGFAFNSGPPKSGHRVRNPLGGKNPQSANKNKDSKGKVTLVAKNTTNPPEPKAGTIFHAQPPETNGRKNTVVDIEHTRFL